MRGWGIDIAREDAPKRWLILLLGVILRRLRRTGGQFVRSFFHLLFLIGNSFDEKHFLLSAERFHREFLRPNLVVVAVNASLSQVDALSEFVDPNPLAAILTSRLRGRSVSQSLP